MKKKFKLITALENERNNFISLGFRVDEHDLAIDYLKNNLTPQDLEMAEETYPLIDAIINDFDMVCSDYNIN